MTNKQKSPDLKKFGDRLQKAQSKSDRELVGDNQPNNMGLAFRSVTEMAASLFVTGLIGWAIDAQFDTSPWGIIIGLILGAVAGMLNAFREAQRLNKSEDE